MTVARLVAAAMLLASALCQPVAAQSTGNSAGARAGASVAPPPAPAVEEIVVDPTAAVAVRAAEVPSQRTRVARASRPTVAPAVPDGRSARDREPARMVELRRLGRPVPSTALPDRTRVVPLHVAQKRARVGTFRVPPGYRPAWEDDRLNPRRAEGTLGGRESMNDIWTTSVPRRLIDPSAGRARMPKPAIVYPRLPATAHGETMRVHRQGSGAGAYGAGVGR